MKILARGLQFWKTHGASATYRATRRKLRLALTKSDRRRPAAPLPFSYVCQRIPYTHASGGSAAAGFRGRVNWIIPNYHRSSGGLRTILRTCLALEQAGYDVQFYIFGETHYVSGSEATEVVRTFYYPLKASVHLSVTEMLPAEFCLATSWHTAYPLRDFAACRRKIYFVQDEESLFLPESSEKAIAEETYRFGFDCVCAGRWLAQRMRGYGNRAVSFDLAYDPAVYSPGGELPERKRVVFYARYHTPRRGVELGLLALTLLKARHPEVEIVLFGSDELPYVLPFDYTLVGILREHDLPDLYRSATVGLSISLTNYSLVPQEMLACGLPVVEVNHPSLQAAYPTSGTGIRLAHPTPERLADALAEVIKLPEAEARRTRAEAARLVGHLSWSNADKVLLDFLASA